MCCLETLILMLANLFSDTIVVSNVSDKERLPTMTSEPKWTVMCQAGEADDNVYQVFLLSDKFVALLDAAFAKVRSKTF